jgi:hypothetical protein
VGDSDEKLAEGIKMLAVSMAPSAKRTILGDLIAVCLQDFLYLYLKNL